MGKDELDFPGFAQEFLRRNPAYRKQHLQMNEVLDAGASPITQEVMARNWGLSFPLSARCACNNIARFLGRIQ